jgi:ABC-type sugar transport system substrate-binding protein
MKVMNATKRLAATAAALALLATACGGAKTDAAAGGSTEKIKVGFITKFPVDFYDTMVTAVKDWNSGHGDVQVVYAQGSSGTDDEGEIAAIQSMVAQGVKAIAITPTSPNVKGELQKAVDKGIKVVLIDNDIPGWTGKSALVATDNLAGGKLAGQWLAGRLKPGAKLAILQGVLGAPSLDARVEGMMSALGTSAEVVAKLPTDCDQTKGLNAAQDILTAHPDVTAIYGACGPPIVGALQAIKAKGKTAQITVVGFDAAPGEITAIKAGDEAASVAQFPAKMGSMGIETAVKAARGETVQANIDTGTEMVTKDNADKFA